MPDDLSRRRSLLTTALVALTLYLSRGQAEKLTARAIREGKNLAALVAEILEPERQ